MNKNLIRLLEEKVNYYNTTAFIKNDPISIPHRFTQKQDIEIIGFLAAILAWGNRTTIINSCNKLLQVMDHAPYQFITSYEEKDLKPLLRFVHRTFNATDLFYFLSFFQHHYSLNESLENAFTQFMHKDSTNIEQHLTCFKNYFFSFPYAPERTHKHISTPAKNSACKRLNMFLRWMVRNDGIVDFGIWKKISPHQLVCPLDVHVARVARRLGLLERQQNDWKAAIELTENLKLINPGDPVRYDFALFGMGVEERL